MKTILLGRSSGKTTALISEMIKMTSGEAIMIVHSESEKKRVIGILENLVITKVIKDKYEVYTYKEWITMQAEKSYSGSTSSIGKPIFIDNVDYLLEKLFRNKNILAVTMSKEN